VRSDSVFRTDSSKHDSYWVTRWATWKSTGTATHWEARDLGRLARNVGEWNEFIATFAGMFKDQAIKEGLVVESAIAGFANFERLEAKGMERLARLRQQKRNKDD
jgi:hypothetical protein